MAFQTMSGIPKVTSTANFYSNTNPLLQSRGIGGFAEPSALFGNGEQGAWWDFSDLDNMYVDSVGSAKVALEGPVGFVVDKRINQGGRGLELVPSWADGIIRYTVLNAVGNGNTATVKNGALILTNTTATECVATATGVVIVSGALYEVIITGSSAANGVGPSYIQVGGTNVQYVGTNVTVRRIVTAGATGTLTFAEGSGTAGDTATINSVSVKLLVGNHLIQATAGARPTLSRRYNLLQKTRDFTDAFWSKQAVTIANTFNICESSSNSAHQVVNTGVAGVVGQSYTLSADIYPLSRQWAYFVLYDNTADRGGYIDLVNGTLNGALGGATATFFPLFDPVYGKGWRVKITATTAVTALLQYEIGPASGNGGRIYVGIDGNPGIRVVNSDMRLTADAALAIPEIQWVDTSVSYDTLGFPAYLLFDGATKWMQSAGAIAYSGNTATGIVGQTTLVGAGSILYETSTNFTANNGTFTLQNVAGVQYVGGLRGTVGFDVVQTTSQGAPDTGVLSHVIDSSQATPSTRELLYRNNTQLAITPTAGSSAGPLTSQLTYIGARAGISNFFNGRMYGLILRNAATNDNDLSMTNKWMGSKCGLFF